MENEIKEDIRKNSDNKLNTTSTFSDSTTLIKNAFDKKKFAVFDFLVFLRLIITNQKIKCRDCFELQRTNEWLKSQMIFSLVLVSYNFFIKKKSKYKF